MSFRNISKIVRNLNLCKNRYKINNLNETEFELLRYVSKHNGIYQNEIAKYLSVDKSLVTRMTKKLLDKKYIIQEDDDLDKRKKIIKITKSFLLIKRDNELFETNFYNKITSTLSNKEKEDLDSLLTKVYIESKKLRKITLKEM